VRLPIDVDRKCRTRVNKRAAGKITKKSHRQENNKYCDTIPLDIFVLNDDQSEVSVSQRKTKSPKKKVNAKLVVRQAGKRLWKGVRVSCKFLWSGLILYGKPFGAMDLNCAKVWEEKMESERKREFSDYSDDRKSERKLLNRGS